MDMPQYALQAGAGQGWGVWAVRLGLGNARAQIPWF